MFEHALEDCLTRMRLEGATPEECLARYPEFRHELAPLLAAAQGLGALDSLEPRPEFRAQSRARLMAHMQANPRRPAPRRTSLAFRYAASLALLFVALAATGTALAQNALPGDSLYGWKLASERVWHGLQGSPLEADIFLTGRRISEIQVIKGKAILEEIGFDAYQENLEQLSLDLAREPDAVSNVNELLQQHREQLKEIIENSQADLPALEELFGIVTLPAPIKTEPGGNNTGGELPLVITATPMIRKGEEQGAEENGDDEEGRGEPSPETEDGDKEPGLLENIISGLFGGK